MLFTHDDTCGECYGYGQFFTGHRVCHHSEDACCAGFWQRHKNHSTLGQVAQRLGFVKFVEEV